MTDQPERLAEGEGLPAANVDDEPQSRTRQSGNDPKPTEKHEGVLPDDIRPEQYRGYGQVAGDTSMEVYSRGDDPFTPSPEDLVAEYPHPGPEIEEIAAG